MSTESKPTQPKSTKSTQPCYFCQKPTQPCYFCRKTDVGTTPETSAHHCDRCGFHDIHFDCYEMNAMQCPMCKKNF
jgi:hypothetical protein